MKPVLVLGAGGFVGRHLLSELLQRGLPVRALVRDPKKASAALSESLTGSATAAKIELVEGDIIDAVALRAASDGCQAVYHLVAIEFERDIHTFERVHVEGTQLAIDAAKEAGVERFLYLGQISPGEREPSIRFTYTKWQGEERVRQSDLRWTVFRAGVILGPGDHFVREMKKLSRWPLVPVAGDGQILLQPVSVWDVAAALAEALPREGSETLELAGPEQLSYAELARRTIASFGKKKPLLRIPRALLYLPALLAAATMKRPPLTPELLRLLNMPNVAKDNALPRLLSRPPMTIDETLTRTNNPEVT